MPANSEIKARLHDRDAMLQRIATLTADPPVVLEQEDTFFPSLHGRLKLRTTPDGGGELIVYDRPDTAGSRESRYELARVPDAPRLRTVLGKALGTMQTVTKTRLLFHVGQTRIHVDAVDGLGDFLELEVVLAPDQQAADGHAIAARLMATLGIQANDLLETAYADMLAARTPRTPAS